MWKKLIQLLQQLFKKEPQEVVNPDGFSLSYQKGEDRSRPGLSLVERLIEETLEEGMLLLILKRKWYTKESTVGELFEKGKLLRICYILEDFERLATASVSPKGGSTRSKKRRKVHGETAIPKGRYEIRLTHSTKFKKTLPLLYNVPGFSGIRIHAGNTAKDTEGCLLPGIERSEDFVGHSKRAFKKLCKMLERTKREGKRIIIEIQ